MRGALALSLVLVLSSCSGSTPSTAVDPGDSTSTTTADPAAPTADPATSEPSSTLPASPRQLTVQVVERVALEDPVFTQGLEVVGDELLVSGGRYGESTLSLVDPDTGRVEQRSDLDDDVFAEGATVVGDRIVQLSWREGRALVWDLASLELREVLPYDTEGWGVCLADDGSLVTSDGSAWLVRRDSDDLSALSRVEVTWSGEPVELLNELECVDSTVWANVWFSDRIVGIDAATGIVTDVVDASGLVDPPPTDSDAQNVLNGIAHVPGTDMLWLTGKEWPELLLVRFVAAG